MSKRRVGKKDTSRDRQSLVSGARRRLLLVVGAAALGAGIIATIFFWPGESGKSSRAYALAPESGLPAKIRKAPPGVREAYRFAVVNRDVLHQIPCYCGCGPDHKSVADCYIRDIKPNGQIEFDPMSLGCGICIDIVRDTMRMLNDGKALKEIRTYVDRTYSRFGPSTPTPPVR